jgi:hypothetical protein
MKYRTKVSHLNARVFTKRKYDLFFAVLVFLAVHLLGWSANADVALKSDLYASDSGVLASNNMSNYRTIHQWHRTKIQR